MEQKTKSILRLVKNEDCPVNETTNVGGTVFLANDASASHTPSTDMIGYEVFSDGDIGQAHVIAHKYHDIERPDLGYQFLKDWLTGRTGTGSDWIHIQFHMALFELDLGQWCDAYTRFKQNILPGAAFTDHALTDAPALLWRLMMSAPFQVPTLSQEQVNAACSQAANSHSRPFYPSP